MMCGPDGTRTRDLLRDRQALLDIMWSKMALYGQKSDIYSHIVS